MFIIKYKNFFFALSALLTVVSLGAMIGFRPWNYGIEFRGGSILEVGYPAGRPTQDTLEKKLTILGWGTPVVQETGTDAYLIRIQRDTKGVVTRASRAEGLAETGDPCFHPAQFF